LSASGKERASPSPYVSHVEATAANLQQQQHARRERERDDENVSVRDAVSIASGGREGSVRGVAADVARQRLGTRVEARVRVRVRVRGEGEG
jgi:hypothetical protein